MFGADNLGELLVWGFLIVIIVFGIKGGKGGGGKSKASTPSE